MNKEKLKKFMRERSTEIILAGGAVLTVVLCAVGVKKKLRLGNWSRIPPT